MTQHDVWSWRKSIFFNKKIKIRRPEYSLPPASPIPPIPLRPIKSHFCFTLPPPTPFKVDVICVLPLNQKHNMGWFLLRFVEYVLYTLLVETIVSRVCWLTCRKQKPVQSKIMQQRLFMSMSYVSLDSFLSTTYVLMVCK